nr:DUF481 domain-containing protein [Hyphomonas sp. Mor2]
MNLSSFFGVTIPLIIKYMCWAPAIAQSDTDHVWSGEGSLSAGVSAGNTETADLGLGLDVTRSFGRWSLGVQAIADYGETDGAETKNRTFFGVNLDRRVNDRLFGYAQLTFEEDAFSSLASRAFVGTGLGYEALVSEVANWTIRGGAGFKYDETNTAMEPLSPTLTDPSPLPSEEALGVLGQSNFLYQLNQSVAFTNDTSIAYANTSTQMGNIAAVTASLTNTLSARISFEARYNSDPIDGFKDTDTISRLALVYGFGK